MLPKVISCSIELIRVLHVDDDPNQHDFIKFFLNQIDPIIKVHCVETPQEALTELENNFYDCLVTDFQMPEIDGIELAKKVREKTSIPIILYTGQGSEEVAETAFSIGIEDYIRKEMDPSHYQVLARRIRHVVEKKQTEMLYENVVEQARDAMCIFIDERIVFANKSALDLFEVEKLGDLIGTNPLRSHKVVSDYLEPGFHKITFKTKNEEDRYLEISTSHMSYSGRKAVLSFIWDTTEKRILEKEKTISQERFRALVELSSDGIATFNTSGYTTFLNDAFSTITGYPKNELLGKHITNLQTLRKRDIFKYVRGLATILQKNAVPSMEFTYKKKDGSSGIGHGYMTIIDLMGKKELFLIAKDITDEKKQEIKYTILSENSLAGVMEIDVNGEILSINKNILKYIEIGYSDIIGKNLKDLNYVNNDIKNTLIEIINKIKIDRRKYRNNIKNFTNGNKEWINIQANPIIFDGEYYGSQLSITDSEESRINCETCFSQTPPAEKVTPVEEDELLVRDIHLNQFQINEALKNIQDSVKILKSNQKHDEKILNFIEDQTVFVTQQIIEINKKKIKQSKTDTVNFIKVDLNKKI